MTTSNLNMTSTIKTLSKNDFKNADNHKKEENIKNEENIKINLKGNGYLKSKLYPQ